MTISASRKKYLPRKYQQKDVVFESNEDFSFQIRSLSPEAVQMKNIWTQPRPSPQREDSRHFEPGTRETTHPCLLQSLPVQLLTQIDYFLNRLQSHLLHLSSLPCITKRALSLRKLLHLKSVASEMWKKIIICGRKMNLSWRSP